MKTSHLFTFILLLLFLPLSLAHAAIDVKNMNRPLLLSSKIYVDKSGKTFKEIVKSAKFIPFNKQEINLGFTRNTTLWIHFTLYNSGEKKETKILQIRNPLLEDVSLYKKTQKLQHKGTLYQSIPRDELHTIFEIRVQPKELQEYYLKVRNTTTALRLSIRLKDKLDYLKDEYHEQNIIFIFLSILGLLFLYNFVLYLYTKERVYVFYLLYLFALLFQQSTYLGITQMFAPSWFVYYDNLAVVFKVNLLFISAVLFAKSFLQTQRYEKINKIYNAILALGLIEIPLFGSPWFYLPEVSIVTALFFIYFNMYAAIYIYKHGKKEARFFVVGWAFQLVGFTLMIIDGLGFTSIMGELTDIVMFLTALEAIVLSLAFIDRYSIFKKEKERLDTSLMQELQKRQEIVELEVQKATEKLKTSLENEKNLLKELHHRSKNNLQLILSLVRMQEDETEDKGLCLGLQELEGRINSIAKIYTVLDIKEDLQKIDMAAYIEELCEDIKALSQKNIIYEYEIRNISLPLRSAGYVGLIVNELVTNSIKYVQKEQISIHIKMYEKEGRYVLRLQDNGAGFSLDDAAKEHLGMKLIVALVENQLHGTFTLQEDRDFNCTIRFSE